MKKLTTIFILLLFSTTILAQVSAPLSNRNIASTCVDEDFVNFSDWTNHGTANDTSSSHYGNASPCRAFGSNDYIISPSVDNPNTLQFYQDASNSGDGETVTLDYNINGNGWVQFSTFTANKNGVNESIDLTNLSGVDLSTELGVTLRFNDTNTGTWYLDDVVIQCGATSNGTTITNITQTPTSVTSSDTVSVSADVTDTDGISGVELHWGTVSGSLGNTIAMSLSSGDTYTTDTDIPTQADGTTVYYEIYALDNNANDATSSEQSYIVDDTPPCATELIISEYIEGSSNNKYLEIYNGTGGIVDLSDYEIRKYNNGASSVSNTLSLSGNLVDSTTYVIENDSESLSVSADLSTNNAVMTFNGDDAIELYNTATLQSVDIIGKIGEDPGTAWGSGSTSTVNHSLVRKATVVNGDTDGTNAFDPATEWDGFAVDDVSHLGSHTMTCAPCVEPTTDALFHANSPQNITTTSVTLNWTNGDGENRIVVLREANTVIFTPTDNTTYTSNSNFGSSADVGTNEYIVYNGNASTVDVTGLTPGTVYYATIYEYNCNVGSEDYFTSGTPTTDIFITDPENAENFNPICISNSSIDLSWSAPSTGNFDGYLLVVREAATPHSVNSLDPNTALGENTDYTIAATYGSTTPNSRILYKGSGTSVTITGLTQGISYVFKLFTYSSDGTIYRYANGTSTNQTIQFQNVINPVAIAANGQVDVSWTNPDNSCFDEILVVANETNGISFSPSGNGSSYVANTVYSAIDQVVFNNNGNAVTVTNLTNGTTYYFEIFVRQGTTWSSGIEVNATPNTQTIFEPGDLVIVGYDNKVGTIDDVVTILTLVDVLPNTTFWYSNATYEIGANANQRTEAWHSCRITPDAAIGTQQFTYTGPDVLPAGSTFCITIDNDQVVSSDFTVHQSSGSGTYNFSDGLTPAGFVTSLNISTSKPDSIFLMQGSWSVDLGGYRLFDGVVLGGIQDGGNWYTINDDLSAIPSGDTANRISRIPPEIECFGIQGTATPGKGFAYYDDTKTGSQITLLGKIADFNANWVQGVGDNSNDISGTSCDASFTFSITGTATAGVWTNAKNDNNWFNCGNWENLTVPDETIDVVINSLSGSDKAVVDDNAVDADVFQNIAQCKNLTLNGEKLEMIGDVNDVLKVHGDLTITNGILNMDDLDNAINDGTLYVSGNWTNNSESNFNEGNSTIIFDGTTAQSINTNSGNDTEKFYNLTLNNAQGVSFASNNIHAAGDLHIIQNTSPITVTANHYVLAGNSLQNDNSTHFIIQNEGSFVQTKNGTDLNTGVDNSTFEVHKTSQPYVMYDYTYWSSPLKNIDVNNAFPTLPNYIYSFNTANFSDEHNGSYPQTTGTPDSYDDLGNDWQLESGNMQAGKGYIAMGEGATFPVTPPTLTTYTQNVLFENGKVNNGIINLNVSLDAYNTANGSGNSFNKNDNLLGNPYPSAISATQFLSTNANLGGTIYFWTHDTAISTGIPGPNYYNFTNDDYATWTAASGGTAAHAGNPVPTGNIASGQGFFVTANTAGQVHFDNDMRVLNSNNNFYRTENRVWLDLTNSNGLFRQILIGFFENATDDEDRLYDGLRLENGTNWDFYSLLNNKKMAIQGLAEFDDEKTIPLGIEIIQTGDFDISIDHLEGELETTYIYLKDNFLNVIHDLKQSDYHVSINTTGNINDRFELVFQRNTLGTDNINHFENVYISNLNENIKVVSSAKMNNVKAYNVLGKEIINVQLNNKETILKNNIKNGTVLFFKITLSNGTVINKKFIKF